MQQANQKHSRLIYPVGELPALVHGSTTISGLENIRAHLDTHLSTHSLSPTQDADLTAFTSHILHHAPPLLSLSRFVSTENYTTVTRPVYSTLLPWPTQYFVPPHLRSKAQAQTAHLGLTSPDFLDADQDSDVAAQRRNRSIIPESIRTLGSSSGKAQSSVTGALTQQPQVGSARFRLDALVDDFCAPLSELLAGQQEDDGGKADALRRKPKEKTFLLSSSSDQTENPTPSSLDCLATAYLSLMLHPTLPQNWLASRIRQRWPSLVSYTETMSEELWGGQRYEEVLPWHTTPSASSRTWLDTTSSFAAYAFSGVPGFGANTVIHPAPPPPTAATATSSDSQAQQQPHTLPTVLLTATAAAAGLAAASTYFALPYLSPPPEEQKRNLSEMGEAGAMLSGLDFSA